MIKALGAEINDFYNNHWPYDPMKTYLEDMHGVFLDESNYLEEWGKLNLKPNEYYVLSEAGWFCNSETGQWVANFEDAFLKWRNQTPDMAYVVIKLPRGQVEDFKAWTMFQGQFQHLEVVEEENSNEQ